MKHVIHTASWLALFTVICAATAYAQIPDSCPDAQAEAYLDVNNVRARIFNNGALFWNGSPSVYEVPKDGGVNAIFKHLVDEQQHGGIYEVPFEARDLPGGVYFYQIEMDHLRFTKPMMRVR